MKASSRLGLTILLIAATAAQPLAAFDYPLSSKAIREAYFLGAGDAGKRAEFFGKYTKRFPVPKTGPYLAMIEFETPYVVIAERVSQNVSNYFAQDAEQEFLGKPAICRLRVQIYFRGSYSWPITRPRTDYTIRLKQHGREISRKTSSSEPLYSSGDFPVLIGIEMDLEYDAEKIESAAPATVEVLSPDGQEIRETFDLAKLR
jgi:hypothetical protein